MDHEQARDVVRAKEGVLEAAEAYAFEYARVPADEIKYRRARGVLYRAVRELQQARGDEDIGGPTPPKELPFAKFKAGIIPELWGALLCFALLALWFALHAWYHALFQ